MYTEEIKNICNMHLDKIIEFRRHFHMYPELGHKEFNTSRMVTEELKNLGMEVLENVSGTGVVGLLKGKYPGKTVLLRADMDAIPVQENSNYEYKSKVDGVSHACGHDGHTATLLGAAMILSELRDELHGNVKFVFQPDEEYGGGAKDMIEEGVLENPHVDAAFGLHLWGPVPEGQIHVKHGAAMAAPDKFIFKVKGKGGHAAMPHLCVDTIMITVQAINNMQSIISRRKNPFSPAVISFCSINAISEYNTLPDVVEVSGTIRTFDPALREWIIKSMEEVLAGICKSQGADYEFIIDEEYALPPVINNHILTDIVQNAAEKIIGIENVMELSEPQMGAEDYSYFSQAVPSSFFFVGISPEGKQMVNHSPLFQWKDEILYSTAATMAQVAVDFLNQDK